MAKFCSNCGTPLAEGVSFCAECGAKITESAIPMQQTAAAQPIQPSAPQNIYPQTQNIYQGIPQGYSVFVPNGDMLNAALPKNERTSKAHRKTFRRRYRDSGISVIFSAIVYIISIIIICTFERPLFYGTIVMEWGRKHYDHLFFYDAMIWFIIISAIFMICGLVNYFISLNINLKAQKTRTQLRYGMKYLTNAIEFTSMAVTVLMIFILYTTLNVPAYKEYIEIIILYGLCLLVSIFASTVLKLDRTKFADNKTYDLVSQSITEKENKKKKR